VNGDITGVVLTSKGQASSFDVSTTPGAYAGHDTLLHGHRTRACEIGHLLDWRRNFAFDPELLATGKLQPGALLAHIDQAARDERDDLGFTPRIHVPRHGRTA
jgi:hypothetical protein